MLFKKWSDSINFAIEGVLHAARTQKHVRLHLIVIILLLLFCFITGLKSYDLIIVSLVATIVVVTEMLNSSIEAVVDLVSPQKREKARIAKDMAAGAVLVAAVSSTITAFYIIIPDLIRFWNEGMKIAVHEAPDIALCALFLVLITVIILKAYFGKGHPLRGGMPSGHTALSFSFFVSSLFIFHNWVIIGVVFIAAIAVSLSRFFQRIHTLVEIFAGAILGSVITWGLFQLLFERSSG